MDQRASRLASILSSPVFENLGVKALSLLLSVAIFSYFHGAGVVIRSLDLPVNVLLPASHDGAPVLLTPLPESVRFTVRALPTVVNSLRPESVGPLQIDLRDGRRSRVSFSDSTVRLPPGVTVLGLSPASLELRWDRLVTRLVPVRANIVGVAMPSTRLVEPLRVEPQSVRVQGPASLVEPMDSVRTEPVDITAMGIGRHDRRTQLEPARGGLTIEEAIVRLHIEVIAAVSERRFSQVMVTPVGSGRVELRPPAIEVLLRGEPSALQGISVTQLVPVVQLDPQSPLRGASSLPVRLYALPPGVSAAVLTPEYVIAVPR